jgi:hypothetical protein
MMRSGEPNRVVIILVLAMVLPCVACTDGPKTPMVIPPTDMGNVDFGYPIDAALSMDIAVMPDMVVLDSTPIHEDFGADDLGIRDASRDLEVVESLDLGRPDLGIDAAPQDAMPLPDFAPQEPREVRCNDQADDDGDDRIDCEDPDCRGAPVCFDLRETCDDGRDNNGDDRVDCDDVTCHLEPGCPPPNVEAFTTEQVEARFVIDCVPCHGPPQAEVMLDLTPPFLDQVLDVPSFETDLVHIKPGDAAQSWIYQKIRYRQLDFMGDGDGMPPEHTWNAADAQRLGLWIESLDNP